MKKKLEWGETPWDNLSQEELLREVQRIYSALEATRSALNMVQNRREPYWQEGGSGYRALDQASQIIDPLHEEYSSESIYSSFFRYANSLLFRTEYKERWVICPECGSLFSGEYAVGQIGQSCAEVGLSSRDGRVCTGTLRWLEWSDLAKEEKSE